MFETGVAGRAAGAVYLAQLQTYEAAIRDTIGLRQQARLSNEQATSFAGCLARHRDICELLIVIGTHPGHYLI